MELVTPGIAPYIFAALIIAGVTAFFLLTNKKNKNKV